MAFTGGGYMDPSTGILGDPNQIPDFQAPKYGSSTGPVSPSGGPYVQAAPQGPAPRGSQGSGFSVQQYIQDFYNPTGPAPSQNNPTGPAPSQNNPQGPYPSQNNPTGPPPNPYGSMHSQGSGFNVGSRRSGMNVPQMGLGASAHNLDPRIKESLAKNAMIGDLFGGYSEWRDQGSPDLGNMWQKYLPVSRAYAASEDVDFDRLRSQGDLRGLPSREEMLAQLGVGQQPQQQAPQGPQMGAGDTMGQFPRPQRPSRPNRPAPNYQPGNADWVYGNVYGPGGWQPPGGTPAMLGGQGLPFNPFDGTHFSNPNFVNPWNPPPSKVGVTEDGQTYYGIDDPGWRQPPPSGQQWQPYASAGTNQPQQSMGPNGYGGSMDAPTRNFPIGPGYLNQFGSNLFGSQTASTSPSVTGTQFSSGKGGPGGKGGSGGFKGGTTQPIRRGGYT